MDSENSRESYIYVLSFFFFFCNWKYYALKFMDIYE